MESIGSVSAMHKRTNSQCSSDSDFSTFIKESDRRAEHYLEAFGQEAYEDHLETSAAIRAHNSVQDREEALAKLARKARAKAIARRLLSVEAMIERKIASIFTNAAGKTSTSSMRDRS